MMAQDLNKGLEAAQAGDFTTALKEWRPLADQGDAAAQYYLGAMYYYGDGVVQDYTEAMRWYLLAADQGHAEAQYSLGVMYTNGYGVVQDYTEGAKWYRLAADQGIADAQYSLGVMYTNGYGVVQDYIRAHMWLNISAVNGDDYAKTILDMIAEKMTSEDISIAQSMARECLSSDYQHCGRHQDYSKDSWSFFEASQFLLKDASDGTEYIIEKACVVETKIENGLFRIVLLRDGYRMILISSPDWRFQKQTGDLKLKSGVFTGFYATATFNGNVIQHLASRDEGGVSSVQLLAYVSKQVDVLDYMDRVIASFPHSGFEAAFQKAVLCMEGL
jgi:hypothetical protein